MMQMLSSQYPLFPGQRNMQRAEMLPYHPSPSHKMGDIEGARSLHSNTDATEKRAAEWEGALRANTSSLA